MNALLIFLRDTFRDATGQPSATLATAFAVNATVALVLPVGLLTGRYPPAEILLIIVTYAALLLGLDFSLSRAKLSADNPAPPTVNVSADTVSATITNETPAQ